MNRKTNPRPARSLSPALPAASALMFGLLLGLGAPAVNAEGATHWHQWGGPAGNFKIENVNLADEWPEAGPPSLWKRDLGDGYSAIAYDDNSLYTLYRKGEKEFVVCLSATDGKTTWEHGYAAPIPEKIYKEFGVGPRAMPLVVDQHVYTVGINGKLICFQKKSGKVAWTKELISDLKGSELTFGYANTPVPYGNTIILPLGGDGQAIVALDRSSGALVWKANDFKNSYATPTFINVDGEEQLVAFMATHAIGVLPKDGTLRWKIPLENQWGTNCTTPVFGPDNRLFVSTEQTGSKLVHLSNGDGKTTAKEIWFQRKPQVVFTNAIRVGNHVYGSFGVKTAPFSALDLSTGEIVWRDRTLNKASSLLADGKLIILDENGLLALATATPEGLDVHSKVELFEKNAWTVPTLIGTKLYARDKKTILALELGDTTSG